MIKKYKDFIKESIKDKMAPISKEQFTDSFDKFINDNINDLSPLKDFDEHPEFKEIADVLNENINELYITEEPSGAFFELWELIDTTTDDKNFVKVNGTYKYNNELIPCTWHCFTDYGVAFRVVKRFRDRETSLDNAWIFSRNFINKVKKN